MATDRYTVTYPCPPAEQGRSLRLCRMLEEAGKFTSSDEVPIIIVDYRIFAINTVFNKAFNRFYLPVGVSWIDEFLINQGFRRSFKDNMRRMLATGEFFVLLEVHDGHLHLNRIPHDWVTRIAVSEITGELLYLSYIEPVVYLASDRQHVSWRKTVWTPTTLSISINQDEDGRDDDESYEIVQLQDNVYGFVPVVPFKLGSEERGIPIWAPAASLIDAIEDVFNDVRLINAYNASPTKFIQTAGNINKIDNTDFLQLGIEDKIGILTYDIGTGLFEELNYLSGAAADILGIPITSILQVGKHASGEAIDKRLETLSGTAQNMREYVGEQMQLMFRMMSALISQGLIEVDTRDPNIIPLLTNQVVCRGDSTARQQAAHEIYIDNLGVPVDLSKFKVPDVRWQPLDDIDPLGLSQLVTALKEAIEFKMMNAGEARKILEFNVSHLVIAADLAFKDDIERATEALGKSIAIMNDNFDSRVAIVT